MTRDELLALAERAAKATGPDRVLDREIVLATGWRSESVQHDDGMNEDVWTDPRGVVHAWWPALTGSIDAARTLVPEGCGFGLVATWDSASGAFRARCFSGYDNHEALAQSAALALTAAALRAQAAMMEGEDG